MATRGAGAAAGNAGGRVSRDLSKGYFCCAAIDRASSAPRENTMIFRSTIAAAAMLAAHPAAAEDHRFEADPIASVRENFVACEVLSQLQRVMENPRFLLAGECVPLRAGDRVRLDDARAQKAKELL